MKENHSRSVVKGITWRVIGTADTIFLSWMFTGSIGDALKIGAAELLSKIALYYMHERIWLRMKIWRSEKVLPDGSIKLVDHHHRSLVKGMSWRFFGTLDTILWAWIVTGEYSKAFKIGFAEVFTKVGLYYLHERVWMNIKWGQAPTKSTHHEVETSNA